MSKLNIPIWLVDDHALCSRSFYLTFICFYYLHLSVLYELSILFIYYMFVNLLKWPYCDACNPCLKQSYNLNWFNVFYCTKWIKIIWFLYVSFFKQINIINPLNENNFTCIYIIRDGSVPNFFGSVTGSSKIGSWF